MSKKLSTVADQAHASLTAADERDCWASPYGEGPNYSNGFSALRDAQVGTGCAVLTLSEEVAKLREGLAAVTDVSPLRGDLASIATAVRELVDALTPAVQPADTTDLSNAIADVRTEIADIADAVRELADAIRIQQQPRRHWFSWIGGSR
ncbi:hypothetical protein [Streptosporangium sp. NPDC048865]|uniref:hypothetical protein n=1 Tax=Streptosporangium sp. NPDC048865 TaxID=3155766 RepID=UPI003426357F